MSTNRIRSAIEQLVLCEACTHGIGSHDGSGCASCACSLTSQDVLERAMEAAREDRPVWSPPNAA
jgi:hypothetical protein